MNIVKREKKIHFGIDIPAKLISGFIVAGCFMIPGEIYNNVVPLALYLMDVILFLGRQICLCVKN